MTNVFDKSIGIEKIEPKELEKGATLLVNKPLGWTSFDVVKKLRGTLKIKKIGHAGTLDPLASGLLIVCTGKNTKEISKFQNLEKTYTGTICLGAITPSFDLETEPEQAKDYSHVTEEDIYNGAKSFLGTIEQVPPIYSSLKAQGKRLYKLARKGVKIEIKPKKVHISQFNVTGIELPYVHFKVTCSKGTYIRSLANDYGQKLKGVGAYLHSLCRTHIGPYSNEAAYGIEEISNSFGQLQ